MDRENDKGTKGGKTMNKNRIILSVFLGCAISLAVVGAAWGKNCGDTAGPGGTNVPCDCGDTVITDTTLISPAADPVNGDPVVSTVDADFCPAGVDGLILQPLGTARVTLRLGSNIIRGSGTGTGVGIRIVGVAANANVPKVTLKNGGIKGFQTGLATDPGTTIKNSTIIDIASTNNSGEGINVAGDNNELNTIQALDNGATGIRVAGNTNALLVNTASRNGGDGIDVSGSGNALRSSRLNRNIGNGIKVEGNNNTMDHATSENNSLDGIVMIGSGDGDPATLELWKNKLTKNGGNGITVDGDNHEIVANQSNTNLQDGIAVVGTGNHLDTNIARENKGDGIIVTGGGNVDDGGNLGKKNGGVQCVIDGLTCTP
jgi:hypothetical protein